jgi:tetratricopeptide (TPR) repeat protein
MLEGDADTAHAKGLEARDVLDRAVQIRTQMFPNGHHLTAAGLYALARAELLIDDPESAQRALDHARRGLEMVERTRGSEHPEISEALFSLGLAEAGSNTGDPEATLQRALVIAEKVKPPSPMQVARILKELGELHARAGRDAEAVEALERAVELYRSGRGDRAPETLATARQLVACYHALGNARSAEVLERQLGPFD